MSDAHRFVLEPDPAWDWSNLEGDVLEVELTWSPDALAGRLDELLATPTLVDRLTAAGISGFTTGPGRAVYGEDAMVEPGTPAPTLVRLIVSANLADDLAYLPPAGLVATDRARSVIASACERLDVRPYR